MSPILVRPVREQFEHDRVIRVLQTRYRRKYEVAINPGAEQNVGVEIGGNLMYPDLLLFSQERGRKVQGTVEVETGESVNTLEAMAEWGPYGRLRTPFFLYVPVNSVDTVRRLCTEHHVEVAELWTFHTAADQVRFTMVHRAPESASHKSRPAVKVVERPPAPPRPIDGNGAPAPEPAAPVKAAASAPPAPRKAAPAKTAKKAAPPKKPLRLVSARPARAGKSSRSGKRATVAKPVARAAKAKRR